MGVRPTLILALAVVVLFYGCGCALVVIQDDDVWTAVLGQSHVEVYDTPGVQVCTTSESSATPAYRPILFDPALGIPPRVKCQTVDPGRKITVDGGPISQALAGFLGLVAGLFL